MPRQLYEQLDDTRLETDRRRIAEQIFGAMLREETSDAARGAFADLCEDVASDLGLNIEPDDRTLAQGELPITATTAMIRTGGPRTRGFLSAIALAPGSPKAILDAGTGPGGVLAAGAKLFHPDARVTAYDIHGPAVRCARKVLDLLGLREIEVVEGDVLRMQLPKADLGITETFRSGLLFEPGAEMVARLAEAARGNTVPAFAHLLATDDTRKDRQGVPVEWQNAGRLDLRTHHDQVVGQLLSTGTGRRPVYTHIALYDRRNDPILIEPAYNGITNPVLLGNVESARPGLPINFHYAVGAPSLERGGLELTIGH